jgi:hypothetical protein
MRRAWLLFMSAGVTTAIASAGAGVASAADDTPDQSLSFPTAAPLPPAASPFKLALLPEDQSVYAPPAPPREDEGINAGGVHVDLVVRYLTDYVYRGIDHSEVGGNEDAPNLQFDGKLSFDLGKLPHPFVGVFVNVFDSDPISRFQEIRPFMGFDWTLRPFVIEAGNIFYIFPERDSQNTTEVYLQVTFDDSWLFRTDRPIVSPYIYAAYDYDKYDGWYFEAGVKHDFIIENTGLTITPLARIAYVYNNPFYSTRVGGKDTGLQHYDVGIVGSYSLNHLFHFSPRYGTFALEGYLYYTDRTSTDLRADIQIWGGMGIGFHY